MCTCVGYQVLATIKICPIHRWLWTLEEQERHVAGLGTWGMAIIARSREHHPVVAEPIDVNKGVMNVKATERKEEWVREQV